jgi:hypothetical protein
MFCKSRSNLMEVKESRPLGLYGNVNHRIRTHTYGGVGGERR